MKAQGRDKDWVALGPDEDAEYDGIIEINLDELEPLISAAQSRQRGTRARSGGHACYAGAGGFVHQLLLR